MEGVPEAECTYAGFCENTMHTGQILWVFFAPKWGFPSKDPLVLQGRNREGLHFCGTPAPSHFFAFTYKHGDWPSSSAWLVEQVGGTFLSHFFFLSTLVGRKKFMAQPLLFLIEQSGTM